MQHGLDLGLSIQVRRLGRLGMVRGRSGPDDQERRPPGPRQLGRHQGGDPACPSRDHDRIAGLQLDRRTRVSQRALDRTQANPTPPVVAHLRPAATGEDLGGQPLGYERGASSRREVDRTATHRRPLPGQRLDQPGHSAMAGEELGIRAAGAGESASERGGGDQARSARPRRGLQVGGRPLGQQEEPAHAVTDPLRPAGAAGIAGAGLAQRQRVHDPGNRSPRAQFIEDPIDGRGGRPLNRPIGSPDAIRGETAGFQPTRQLLGHAVAVVGHHDPSARHQPEPRPG